MLKVIPSKYDGTPVDVQVGIRDKDTLISESMRTLACHWKSGVNDASETITIVTAKPNQSIMLTDMVITSSKKVNSSTVTVQFYDGTNTETIMVLDGAEAPIEFSLNFQGGVRGWKDADLQVVTDAAAMYVVTFVGYIHVSSGSTKPYGVWNAER